MCSLWFFNWNTGRARATLLHTAAHIASAKDIKIFNLYSLSLPRSSQQHHCMGLKKLTRARATLLFSRPALIAYCSGAHQCGRRLLVLLERCNERWRSWLRLRPLGATDTDPAGRRAHRQGSLLYTHTQLDLYMLRKRPAQKALVLNSTLYIRHQKIISRPSQRHQRKM